MDFEELYSNITGELTNASKELNVFERGKKCAELSQKAYSIKQSLYARLCKDEDDELCELEDISNEIAKEIAKTAYEYALKKD